jgi:hypothetical protein
MATKPGTVVLLNGGHDSAMVMDVFAKLMVIACNSEAVAIAFRNGL